MILLTSDWHLTNRRIDEYRWEMFDWIRTQIDHWGLTGVFHLGDVTDKKDRHPARLVNRTVKAFGDLASHLEHGVHVLMGNHDYEDPDVPFFREVLPRVDGVHFYHRLTFNEVAGMRIVWAPHTHETGKSWKWGKGQQDKRWQDRDLALFHQTFNGAQASNGFEMTGAARRWRSSRIPISSPVFSGDIHVPQKLGRMVYVGSPFPVAFGDTFKPRVILLDPETREWESADRPSIRRLVINIEDPSELDDVAVTQKDQVKIVLTLPRSRVGEWKQLRAHIMRWAIRTLVSVRSIEMREKKGVMPNWTPRAKSGGKVPPSSVLKRYSKAQELSPHVIKAGLSLLDEASQ